MGTNLKMALCANFCLVAEVYLLVRTYSYEWLQSSTLEKFRGKFAIDISTENGYN